MIRKGTIGAEILRNRASLKIWVARRIALTRVTSEEDQQASSWFHNMKVADRSRLMLDLARIGHEGADVRQVASGPLGELVTRFPHLIDPSLTDRHDDPIGMFDDLAMPISVID